MYCPRCGVDNREHAQFCEKCGFNLPVAVSASSQQAPGPLAPGQRAYATPYPQPMPPPPPPSAYADPRMRMPGQVVVDPTGRRYAEGKNPAVAVILSFFLSGLGQIYNGDVKKCFLMWGIFIVIIILAVITGGAAGVLGFGIWVWSMVDAYNVASRKSPLW